MPALAARHITVKFLHLAALKNFFKILFDKERGAVYNFFK